MLRRIRNLLQRHTIRPLIYTTTTRFLLGFAIALLWARFSDHSSGGDRKSFAYVAAAVVFALLGWIAYLRLDGMHLPKLFTKRTGLRRKPERSFGDMIDHVDEEPPSFDELDDSEKDAVCIVADCLCAAAFAVLSFL